MEGEERKYPNPCPQLPGTILRIFIPAGATINFFNFIELTSPGGICVILRFPFFGGLCSGRDIKSFFDSIRKAGGKIEFTN